MFSLHWNKLPLVSRKKKNGFLRFWVGYYERNKFLLDFLKLFFEAVDMDGSFPIRRYI
jgi:hypothetical protein